MWLIELEKGRRLLSYHGGEEIKVTKAEVGRILSPKALDVGSCLWWTIAHNTSVCTSCYLTRSFFLTCYTVSS